MRLLANAGSVLVYRDSGNGHLVAELTDSTVEIAGAWRCVERIGGDRPGKQIVFERADGHRFEYQTA